MDHLDKELVEGVSMGSEETIAPRTLEEDYRDALKKISKSTACSCPGIEYGANHSASCPTIIAKNALNGHK